TQQSHFIASIMAYVKLERLKIMCSKNHFALKSIMLANAIKAHSVLYKDYLSQKLLKIGDKNA
ncbi:MAG: hypothetical protein ACRDE5_04865, partial [Ginsengibacter sp.]